MNEPIKITAKLGVYLASWSSPQSLIDAVRKGDHQRAAGILHFSTADMSAGSEPWPLVGGAEVVITLLPEDKIIAGKLVALQVELEHARAEWLTKQNEILERISKLQALTNEVQA